MFETHLFTEGLAMDCSSLLNYQERLKGYVKENRLTLGSDKLLP